MRSGKVTDWKEEKGWKVMRISVNFEGRCGLRIYSTTVRWNDLCYRITKLQSLCIGVTQSQVFALSTYGPRNELVHRCLYLAIIASLVLVMFYVMTNNKIKCLNSFAITWYCVVYMPFLMFLYELKEMRDAFLVLFFFVFLMIKNIPYHFICFCIISFTFF